ncbi:hypothetical protein [Streptomyces sp. NPDC059398]|uniref:hypothetical protein n=1 Tax=Streptomyces sp. NPDC059398 TaxID=3346820 RepID=UPI0036C006B9
MRKRPVLAALAALPALVLVPLSAGQASATSDVTSTAGSFDPYANDSNGIQYASLDVGAFSGSTLKGLREARPSRRPSA